MRGFIGWPIADIILKFFPRRIVGPEVTVYDEKSKLECLFGPGIWEEFRGKTVIDFGCGEGKEVSEIARHAKYVNGIESRLDMINTTNARIKSLGLANATATSSPLYKADIIVSLDSFEHFADPAAILRTMATLLQPEGQVLVSFGPIWGHPLGGHMFSVFKWAHLIFTEHALMRWRPDYRIDGFTHFEDLPDGLNRMTIRKFKRLVLSSPFYFREFKAVPIKAVKMLHNRLTQEFFTSVIQCRLALRS
jgi:SAM-dependent methyltransferase